MSDQDCWPKPGWHLTADEGYCETLNRRDWESSVRVNQYRTWRDFLGQVHLPRVPYLHEHGSKFLRRIQLRWLLVSNFGVLCLGRILHLLRSAGFSRDSLKKAANRRVVQVMQRWWRKQLRLTKWLDKICRKWRCRELQNTSIKMKLPNFSICSCSHRSHSYTCITASEESSKAFLSANSSSLDRRIASTDLLNDWSDQQPSAPCSRDFGLPNYFHFITCNVYAVVYTSRVCDLTKLASNWWAS